MEPSVALAANHLLTVELSRKHLERFVSRVIWRRAAFFGPF